MESRLNHFGVDLQTVTDEQDTPTDETYGEYAETPHTDILLNFTAWDHVVSQVLEYQLGPPIAWEYDGGVLFLWGDELNEDLLWEIADGCNELEQQYSRGGHYEAA